MKLLLFYLVIGIAYSPGLILVLHQPKRASATLRAFIDAVMLSGLSLKEVAAALEYSPSQFAKILRGEPSHKLDLERFEGRLPYAVAQRFLPKLADIYLATHMQQSAAVLSHESERAS